MTDLETLKLDANELYDEALLREMEIKSIQFAIAIMYGLMQRGIDITDRMETVRKRIELLQKDVHLLGTHECHRGKYSLT